MKTIHLGNTMAITIKCGISNSTPNIRVANELSHAIRIHEISPGSVFCSACFYDALAGLPVDQPESSVADVAVEYAIREHILNSPVDYGNVIDVEEEQ